MTSRGASKSRSEKTKTVQNAPTPSAIHDIIPGKFNENDWNDLLESDEADNFIVDIINGIVENTLKACYDVYIQKQLIPFTVDCAKNDIVKCIEMEFINLDFGECDINGNSTWDLDDEPESLIAECWAQGAVPVIHVRSGGGGSVTPSLTASRPESVEGVDSAIEQSDNEITEEVLRKSEEVAALGIGRGTVPQSMIDAMQLQTMTPIDEVPEPEASPIPKTNSTKSRPVPPPELMVMMPQPPSAPKFKKYRGKVTPVASLDETLAETERRLTNSSKRMKPAESDKNLAAPGRRNVLKLQSGRPPGEKDVIYDEMGNVVGIKKLNVEDLPDHTIKTKFTIVDPKVEEEQAALDAMRTGKALGAEKKTGGGAKKRAKPKEPARVSLPTEPELPAPLFENVEIAPGVTIREGDRVHQGSQRKPRRAETLTDASRGQLRPLTIKKVGPTLELRELLNNQCPTIRPARESPIMSPILQRPTHSPSQAGV